MSTPCLSDRIFTEKLILEVQKHPILYNPREAGYKDRFKSDAHWQAVASCMGSSAAPTVTAPLPATPRPGVGLSNKRKRGEDRPNSSNCQFQETAARFLEAKMEGKTDSQNKDLESLRGLLPHMAVLSPRRKRTSLRHIYNLVFDMVEEEETENMSVVYL
ncbi:hypothetical protein ElyMa_003394500 [Elysia marginata]|uniref:MADF domain-containing protein n=1 Tax=Elysia marginata TaxID=1093978 RepID=A0AAV4JNZ9_9GAST|nr:hypothetical protein ElyMa_003394500 [Elysia marginata]